MTEQLYYKVTVRKASAYSTIEENIELTTMAELMGLLDKYDFKFKYPHHDGTDHLGYSTIISRDLGTGEITVTLVDLDS